MVTKLNIHKINNVTGQLRFAGNNSNIKRIDETDPLRTVYTNGIAFHHSYEVLDFNESVDFDVLLGTDIPTKINISLTGAQLNGIRHND